MTSLAQMAGLAESERDPASRVNQPRHDEPDGDEPDQHDAGGALEEEQDELEHAAKRSTVLGLDLSLTGAGLVAVPADWGGDWSRIARATVGHKLKKDASEADRIGRLVRISGEVVAFSLAHRCTSAVIEQYAFTSRHAHAHALGELGGVVRVLITTRVGIPLEVVPPASARKLILGRLPRKDVKVHTRAALTRIGMPPAWTDDEADAFVIANHALAESGGFAFAVEAA